MAEINHVIAYAKENSVLKVTFGIYWSSSIIWKHSNILPSTILMSQSRA